MVYYEKTIINFKMEEYTMRGFREVERNIEREKLNKDKKEEGYKQIKPETNITFEEAKAFVESLFA